MQKAIILHQIKINYNLSGLSGRFSIYENNYFIGFGDMVNYDYFSCILFDLDKYESPFKINLEHEKTIEELYVITPKTLIYSQVTSNDNNTIQIALFNTESADSSPTSISRIPVSSKISVPNFSMNLATV